MAEEARAARHHLVELIAESDEAMMRYLEDDVLTPDELRPACERQLWVTLVPIPGRQRTEEQGVQLMLDAIVDTYRRHLMYPGDRY